MVGSAISEHGVENRQELTHTCHQRHLLGLPRFQESFVELSNGRIVACGSQGSHYRVALTGALPPQILRFSLKVPESLLNGATPTSAERRLDKSVPSSGSPASSVWRYLISLEPILESAFQRTLDRNPQVPRLPMRCVCLAVDHC